VCTLIILNEYIEGYPLVVAANRDERYDRASREPDVVFNGTKSLIRPWDTEKDGTWMGVAEDGWFVGITNQDDGKHDTHALSRGKVVDACLNAGGHRGAARLLAQLDPTQYNPFNIAFGRQRALVLSRVCPGQHLDMQPFPPGVHVISNDCCSDKYKEKVDRATERAKTIKQDTCEDDVKDKLLRILMSHETTTGDPFQALCVHADEHSFGTRSTSIVTVSNDGEVEYWFSEGPPCKSVGLSRMGRLLHMDFGDIKIT
jgi:uncharacterized protein with NRDE domain